MEEEAINYWKEIVWTILTIHNLWDSDDIYTLPNGDQLERLHKYNGASIHDDIRIKR